MSPGFTASLDDLRTTIAGHLDTPHTFGGEQITGGERLHDIVGGLCAAVNSTEDICPPSVLEAIDTMRVHKEVQRALGAFESMVELNNIGEVVRCTQIIDDHIKAKLGLEPTNIGSCLLEDSPGESV